MRRVHHGVIVCKREGAARERRKRRGGARRDASSGTSFVRREHRECLGDVESDLGILRSSGRREEREERARGLQLGATSPGNAALKEPGKGGGEASRAGSAKQLDRPSTPWVASTSSPATIQATTRS